MTQPFTNLGTGTIITDGKQALDDSHLIGMGFIFSSYFFDYIFFTYENPFSFVTPLYMNGHIIQYRVKFT